MKLQLILIVLPYLVFGFGVDQPGTCEETNKKVKPQSNITILTILGKMTDMGEYGDEPIDKVCAWYNFVQINETTLRVTKTYRTKANPIDSAAMIYVVATEVNGAFTVVRQDAAGLPMQKFDGFIIHDDGNISVWYVCRDIDNGMHEAQGFILKRNGKEMTPEEAEASNSAYDESGIDSKYVQKMEQLLPQCDG